MTVLELTGVSVSFGDLHALRDVGLTLEAGTVTGLIGPNGAGKTTLLDVVSGFLAPARGEVVLTGRPLGSLPAHRRAALGLGRTFQAVELFDDLSIGENLLVAAETARTDPDSAVSATRIWAAGVVGLQHDDTRLAGQVSHGERKRLALARALVARPQLLLLDEPAAGLDPEERRILVAALRDVAAAGAAVLLVDHDLGLVLHACDRVVVLDFGAVIADGTPAAIRADPAVAAAYVGPGATSRGALRPPPPAPPESRTPALSVRNLSAGYGDATVVAGVDLDVGPGEIVALLGPNGAGKTTTLLAVSGALPQVDGVVEVLGERLRRGAHRQARRGVAYVLADRRVFAGLTAAENLRLASRSDAAVGEVLDLLPALRRRLGQPAGALSGGEQQMLALARALVRRPRLLVVDELSLGLAPRVVSELLDTLATLGRERGTAILLAEQHAELALSIAHRAYVLVAGRIVASGPAEQLAADPQRLAEAYLGGPRSLEGPRPLVPGPDDAGPLSRDEKAQGSGHRRTGRHQSGPRRLWRRRG